MAEIPNVRLSLANSLGNVTVVREALLGVAEALGLDALETDDICTAATETCKNVVHHAYEGQEGPLEVELYTLDRAVDVVVRDHGIGIRPHVGERTQPHTGIGLPMVHALAQRVLYTNIEGGGTEVRMLFAMPNVNALAPDANTVEPTVLGAAEHANPAEQASSIELAVTPRALAEAVLPRVLGALRSSG